MEPGFGRPHLRMDPAGGNGPVLEQDFLSRRIQPGLVFSRRQRPPSRNQRSCSGIVGLRGLVGRPTERILYIFFYGCLFRRGHVSPQRFLWSANSGQKKPGPDRRGPALKEFHARWQKPRSATADGPDGFLLFYVGGSIVLRAERRPCRFSFLEQFIAGKCCRNAQWQWPPENAQFAFTTTTISALACFPNMARAASSCRGAGCFFFFAFNPGLRAESKRWSRSVTTAKMNHNDPFFFCRRGRSMVSPTPALSRPYRGNDRRCGKQRDLRIVY